MGDFFKALSESRAEASELWAELQPYHFQDRYHLIRTHRRFVTWGLCERLCQESARLTVIDPDRAVEAAEVAVLVSDLLKADEPGNVRLYRLRSYAWAHDGHAPRLLGDLLNAEESFSIAEAWWEAGAGAVGESSGYESLLLDYEASLRIAQRRFPEALALLDRLFGLPTHGAEHRDAHLAGRALVKKALALQEMEEPELAIGLLTEAEALVDGQRDPRLLLCLRHNIVRNRTSLEAYQEAQALMPQVSALCRELGNPLDLIRLRWIEARIAAGLGHTEEAPRG